MEGVFIRGHFPSINKEAKAQLSDDYNEEEILKVLRSMSPLNALGPDRYQSIQGTLSTIGQTVISFVKRILSGKAIPEGLTDVLLVLVSKTKKPAKICQFRPINLCNAS